MITRHLTDVMINPDNKRKEYFKCGHTGSRSYSMKRTIIYINYVNTKILLLTEISNIKY